MKPNIKSEFERQFDNQLNGPWSLMTGDSLAVAQSKRAALWAAKFALEQAAKVAEQNRFVNPCDLTSEMHNITCNEIADDIRNLSNQLEKGEE